MCLGMSENKCVCVCARGFQFVYVWEDLKASDSLKKKKPILL